MCSVMVAADCSIRNLVLLSVSNPKPAPELSVHLSFNMQRIQNQRIKLNALCEFADFNLEIVDHANFIYTSCCEFSHNIIKITLQHSLLQRERKVVCIWMHCSKMIPEAFCYGHSAADNMQQCYTRQHCCCV